MYRPDLRPLLFVSLAAVLSACSSQPEISSAPQSLGGSCDYDRQQLLARQPGQAVIFNDQVELQTSDNRYVPVSQAKLAAFPDSSYFNLDVSTRISGDCQPHIVHSVTPFQLDNINIQPSDSKIYQSGFVLNAVKACLGEYSLEYCSGTGLIGDLTLDQASLLRQSQPREASQCSASSLAEQQTALSSLTAENAILLCTPSLDDSEILIQLETASSGTTRIGSVFSSPTF